LTLWLHRFAPGPVLLVGHSWAGGVATLAAAADDSSIAGIVLMASIGPSCLLWIDPLLAAPVLGEAMTYPVLGLGRRPVARAAAKILRARLAPEDAPFALASGAAMRHRPLWRSFLIEQRALVHELPDVSRALPEIAVPATIVTGTRDQVIPRRTVDALHSGIAHSTLVEIDGGHDLQLRQPQEAARTIAAAAEQAFGAR
jgi:pimeloyl-ACP methyl ester carboxylesterase